MPTCFSQQQYKNEKNDKNEKKNITKRRKKNEKCKVETDEVEKLQGNQRA